jgi:hypothetical protein
MVMCQMASMVSPVKRVHVPTFGRHLHPRWVIGGCEKVLRRKTIQRAHRFDAVQSEVRPESIDIPAAAKDGSKTWPRG